MAGETGVAPAVGNDRFAEKNVGFMEKRRHKVLIIPWRHSTIVMRLGVAGMASVILDPVCRAVIPMANALDVS